MKKLTTLDWIALVLLIIGGLNWGLIALFEYDLVTTILGAATVYSQIIYILVAISAIYLIVILPRLSKK